MKQKFDPADWVTAAEIGKALGVTSSTVNRWACLGLLPKPKRRPDGLEVWPREAMKPLMSAEPS